MEKEQKVVKVGEDQQKFYDTEAKKIKSIQSNFQTAKEKVQQYITSQDSNSLTLEERKSLLSIFEGFYNLDQEKRLLFSKLKEIGYDIVENFEPSLREGTKKKVKQSLEKINWNNGELKVMKNIKGERSKDNLYGWKNWNLSPFSIFYKNQEEWLKDMQKYEISLTTQKTKVRQEKQRCGLTQIALGGKRSPHIDSCQPNIQEYKQVAQKSKDAIEMHIAKWLLEKMGQLPNSQLEKK